MNKSLGAENNITAVYFVSIWDDINKAESLNALAHSKKLTHARRNDASIEGFIVIEYTDKPITYTPVRGEVFISQGRNFCVMGGRGNTVNESNFHEMLKKNECEKSFLSWIRKFFFVHGGAA